MKKKEFIKNIDIQVNENCTNNFNRIFDKNYHAEVSRVSFDKTLEHIKRTFAKPYST